MSGAGYDEPARSYRSAVVLALVFVAGFGVDLSLSVHGAVTHLPGWIGAFVIVVGIGVVIVHAARATSSLHVDDSEIRVGDESIDRAEVSGFVPDGPDDLAVLGWPNGMPRGLKGVTLRLDRGIDVVIPTRHPDRLRRALGAEQLHPGPSPTERPRPAEPDELALLAEIDERAETVFRLAGHRLPRIAFDDAGVRAAAAVFVTGRPPVGFVRVDVVDGAAHVAELAVIPGSMRRGLGSALLEQACRWAGEQGLRAVTLCTFADVAWNAPWYARHGFAEVSALTPGVRALRERERADGLDAVGRRVVMRREIAAGHPSSSPPTAPGTTPTA